ncbi:MAG: thymidylate synthase [Candidatus Helarchaeota archaeon]
MRVIKSESIKSAWKTAKKLIIEEGSRIQDGTDVLIEYINLFLSIYDPKTSDKEDTIEDRDIKAWMRTNFREIKRIKELNNTKSYAWRLYSYGEKDQIEWVIKKLKLKPESKSATITTFLPLEDENYIPCVSLLDFKIRNNALFLIVTCRSLDFGMKALYNLFCLSDILHEVGNELRISDLKLQVHVISAHVYEKDLNGK